MPFTASRSANREGRRVRKHLVATMIAAVIAGLTLLASPVAPGHAAPLPPFSRGAPIPLGPGISLTPADGWTVAGQTDNEVVVTNASQNALLDVRVGTADSNDPAQELKTNGQQFLQSNGLSNVNLAAPQPGTVDSRFFQQRVTQGFTANDSKGVAQKGTFTELMNTGTSMAAFAAFQATPDAYDAGSNDATTMINSML
jgi:hypothetical protein